MSKIHLSVVERSVRSYWLDCACAETFLFVDNVKTGTVRRRESRIVDLLFKMVKSGGSFFPPYICLQSEVVNGHLFLTKLALLALSGQKGR